MNDNTNGVKQDILRGDIYMIDLSPGTRSELQGVRPCMVVQNNMGNKHSRTVTVIPLTSMVSKKQMPTHVRVTVEDGFGLLKDSVLLCEGIRTIDKERFRNKLGSVNDVTMTKVEHAIMINLGMFS